MSRKPNTCSRRHLPVILVLAVLAVIGPAAFTANAGENTMPISVKEMNVKADVDDSFVSCLCGILQSWGREVDYARVAGLSGIVFAPVLDTGEDCRAWWMEGGDDIQIAFLGEALGFTVEAVRVADTEQDWANHSRWKDLPPARAAYLQQLKAALENEKAVIVHTWPTWSVSNGWSEDLAKIPFETMPGFGDLVRRARDPSRTAMAYILTPANPVLTEPIAVARALEFGKKVANGTIDNGRFCYGDTLYQAAADCLDREPFCEPCGERSWSCAIRTLQRIAGHARSASAFLEGIGSTEASKAYGAIASLAEQYRGRQLEGAWGDPIFRGQLKADFLKLGKMHRGAAVLLSQ
jgi:hypothetical protein